MSTNIVADAELLTRFAEWLLAQSDTPNTARRLMRGVQVKSPAIGRQLMVALDNAAGGAQQYGSLRDQMQEEFSEAEIESVFRVAGAPPDTIVWSHSAASQRRRRDALNEAAVGLGFESWTALETAVINGRVQLQVVP